MILTPLNIEQSLARYLADQFKTEGFNIKWFDSNQTENIGGVKTVTLIKEFPAEATNMARHDGPFGANIINVPAFSVFSNVPSTDATQRMGIGESLFEWQAQVRIDGFADTELEWYTFAGYFQQWFGNPDIRIDLRDYQSDLTSSSPIVTEEKIQFLNSDISKTELDERPAVRFYLNLITTAVFVE